MDKTLVVTDHKKRQAIWCQESANITKNAEALMESASSRRDDNTFMTAKHLEHVKPMFKLVWSPVLAVFSVGLQVLLYRVWFQCIASLFSQQTSVAIVIGFFLAEMGRIPCCGRPEPFSSNI